MKNTLSLPLLLFIVTFSMFANAQTKISMFSNDVEITVSKDTLATLTAFTGIYSEGKTYLRWSVVCEKVDGTYIIYKSFDGINFELLGNKQGIGVPISVPISYYFQDENPNVGTSYYKLIHISKNKTYLASEKIYVERDEMIVSKTK